MCEHVYHLIESIISIHTYIYTDQLKDTLSRRQDAIVANFAKTEDRRRQALLAGSLSHSGASASGNTGDKSSVSTTAGSGGPGPEEKWRSTQKGRQGGQRARGEGERAGEDKEKHVDVVPHLGSGQHDRAEAYRTLKPAKAYHEQAPLLSHTRTVYVRRRGAQNSRADPLVEGLDTARKTKLAVNLRIAKARSLKERRELANSSKPTRPVGQSYSARHARVRTRPSSRTHTHSHSRAGLAPDAGPVSSSVPPPPLMSKEQLLAGMKRPKKHLPSKKVALREKLAERGYHWVTLFKPHEERKVPFHEQLEQRYRDRERHEANQKWLQDLETRDEALERKKKLVSKERGKISGVEEEAERFFRIGTTSRTNAYNSLLMPSPYITTKDTPLNSLMRLRGLERPLTPSVANGDIHYMPSSLTLTKCQRKRLQEKKETEQRLKGRRNWTKGKLLSESVKERKAEKAARNQKQFERSQTARY